MQVLPSSRTLFVSTTDSALDARGGIEMVDLETLRSVGYALTEADGGSDMGGFVMTSEKEGYYVFHTDLLASTHLRHFTIGSGPDPGQEIVARARYLGQVKRRLALLEGTAAEPPAAAVAPLRRRAGRRLLRPLPRARLARAR